MTLTNREQSFLALCLSGTDNRLEAIAACREALGRPLITTPVERANVAAELSQRGFDGLGRVGLGLSDLNAAAAGDKSLPGHVRN